MPQNILLVEDNDQNRYLLTFLLESQGYKVVAASDGATAINSAHSTPPDAILLDIQLPGMDGYTVASRMRTIASLRDVPIIAVTSYAMPGDRERAMAAGCTGHIQKPIDPETFLDEIKRALAVAPTEFDL
jgi:CheY-like chemotaxis protein